MEVVPTALTKEVKKLVSIIIVSNEVRIKEVEKPIVVENLSQYPTQKEGEKLARILMKSMGSR